MKRWLHAIGTKTRIRFLEPAPVEVATLEGYLPLEEGWRAPRVEVVDRPQRDYQLAGVAWVVTRRLKEIVESTCCAWEVEFLPLESEPRLWILHQLEPIDAHLAVDLHRSGAEFKNGYVGAAVRGLFVFESVCAGRDLVKLRNSYFTLVSDRLAERITAAGCTGVSFSPVGYTT